MASSNMFIANGAAAMAFKTNGSRIDYGVNACGRRCGVFGSAGAEFGREAVTAGVGVWGDGKVVGVQGRGSFSAIDEQERPTSTGVRGEGGMRGVAGFCATGAAVFGQSMSGGRGGEFHCNRAQIRLVPFRPEGPKPRDPADWLPADGLAGDLLALWEDAIGATLWFCDRGSFMEKGQLVPAMWTPVQLGAQVKGRRT